MSSGIKASVPVDEQLMIFSFVFIRQRNKIPLDYVNTGFPSAGSPCAVNRTNSLYHSTILPHPAPTINKSSGAKTILALDTPQR
jgi:hypothetical protein